MMYDTAMIVQKPLKIINMCLHHPVHIREMKEYTNPNRMNLTQKTLNIKIVASINARFHV